MFYKRKFYSFIVVVLVVAYGFFLNQEALAITDVNTNIIEHWDDPEVQDAYYNWDKYVQINTNSKSDNYPGDQYNAQGEVKNDWLTIGPITENTNLYVLYAAIIGASNPNATGKGDDWETILQSPNWEIDLAPDRIAEGGATVTFYIINSNGQGEKGMPVEITVDEALPTPPINPDDSSTESSTSSTSSASS
ncbi:MAG: hypothetical protein ACLUSM_23715, partial [Enterococcus avium]